MLQFLAFFVDKARHFVLSVFHLQHVQLILELTPQFSDLVSFAKLAVHDVSCWHEPDMPFWVLLQHDR